MIFVTAGNQKFQFNRLLKAIDELVDREIIQEPVIAQIGYSTYLPKHYEAVDFMCKEEFHRTVQDCSLLITHGGAGTILEGLELKKRIVAIPRRKAFGEHVDDHQVEITEVFEKMGCICVCREMKELSNCIEMAKSFVGRDLSFHFSNTVNFVNKYLDEISQG